MTTLQEEFLRLAGPLFEASPAAQRFRRSGAPAADRDGFDAVLPAGRRMSGGESGLPVSVPMRLHWNPPASERSLNRARLDWGGVNNW
ncbi:hypothetical protein ACFYXD_37600 [Streptomyces platensis]|uniref:hypothetical protein n=1 Tax=Streptomyces platensis TaxID=58346 RepID=UPI0036AC586D